jgi:hypothetical protein
VYGKFLKPGLIFGSNTRGPTHGGTLLHASLIFVCEALDLSHGGNLKHSQIFECKISRQLLKWDILRDQG